MKIWYKLEHGKPEVVDDAPKSEIGYLFQNYLSAFGCAYGQPRYGKDKLWIGRKKDEPKN